MTRMSWAPSSADTDSKATLVILAGGESRRMGRPKHLLPTPEGTMIDRLHARLGAIAEETLVVGRSLTVSTDGLRTVEDGFAIRSPLVGIYSGLLACKTERAVVIACDMPHVSADLLRLLLDRGPTADVVVPVINGYYEPLCAVYRRSALPVMLDHIRQGRLKVTDIYARLRIHRVSEKEIRTVDPLLRSFENLNTPRDLVVREGEHRPTALGS